MTFLRDGGIRQQACEKLDRLGLLLERKPIKARAAELKVLVQKHTSIDVDDTREVGSAHTAADEQKTASHT